MNMPLHHELELTKQLMLFSKASRAQRLDALAQLILCNRRNRTMVNTESFKEGLAKATERIEFTDFDCDVIKLEYSNTPDGKLESIFKGHLVEYFLIKAELAKAARKWS